MGTMSNIHDKEQYIIQGVKGCQIMTGDSKGLTPRLLLGNT